MYISIFVQATQNALRLETAKNATSQRKKIHADEAVRYERNKKKATKAHEDVRMAILDRSMQVSACALSSLSFIFLFILFFTFRLLYFVQNNE